MLIIPLLCKFINSVYFMLQHVSIWHPVPNVGHGAGGVHVVFTRYNFIIPTDKLSVIYPKC